MNMKDYEKQAAELTAQAQRLEATMLTYRALAHCVKNGHSFTYTLDAEQGKINGMCGNCGIYVEGENLSMWFADENEEGFGDLAGKSIAEIQMELPVPEEDEEPTVPLENEANSSGAYKVDVSSIIGKKGK